MTNEYMSYVDNIKTGDIIVFSSVKLKDISSLFSYIVRLFTMSEYSHLGIAWVVNGRHFLIEAQVPEVKITPLIKKSDFYHIAMDLTVTEEDLGLLFKKIGESYSVLEAIKAYLKLNSKENNKWICVELVEYFLNLKNIDIGKVHTPSALVKAILQKPYKHLRYVKN